MAAGTKKAVVIADVVAWTTPIEGRPLDSEYHRASRDDKVDLPVAEFDRLAALGAVAEPAVAAQAQVERDELDTGVFTDEELANLDAAERAAYVGQHPDEALRVYQLEVARRRPAKTVLEATGYTSDDKGNAVLVDGTARIEDDGAGVPPGGAVVTQ